MVDTSDLTTKQREAISLLPASKHEIADQMGVSPNTAKSHIEALRSKGVNLEYDSKSGKYTLVDQPKVRRVSTKNTGTKTREANDYITEIERTILRRLEQKEPLVATQDTNPNHEDIVLHVTDLHIGDVVENQRGEEIYNTRIAEKVMRHITEKVLELKQEYESFTSFDTLHVLYGGDMVTNENIYDGQAFDIDSLLADQMSTAVNAMSWQLKSLAREFDTVNVVCQPGNHGKTRASGVSKQANMDLVAYRWLDDVLRESLYDNINFTTSEATWYRTFDLRDGQWTGFLTHGQDAQAHVDATAASSRDWRGWLNEFEFSVAYRGHLHTSKREPVMNGPNVFQGPSPKPGDEWVSRIGQGSVSGGVPKRLAQVHGVSDERPVTWETVIDSVGLSAY